jgi:hypothetical protein
MLELCKKYINKRLFYTLIYIIDWNWAYTRWQCLQRPYIQQGNCTYISQKQRKFSQYNTVRIHKYNTSKWTLQQKNTENTNILPRNKPGPSSL